MPLFVECVDEAGARRNVVLKLRDPRVANVRPWDLCIVRDLVGTILARRLGLLVPDYAIVDVGEPFVRASRRHPDGLRIAANIGANFGSVRIDSVLEAVEGDDSEWAPVLMFDALAFNTDRMAGNPNALWTGKDLYLIDHGMLAPTWTFVIDGTTDTSLFGLTNTRLHAGFSRLQGKGASYARIAQAWPNRVSFEFLRWLRLQVPAWWAPSAAVDELFRFLGARSAISRAQEIEITGHVK